MIPILVLILSLSSSALAINIPSGHEVGNGGFYFACTDESSYGHGVFSMDRIEGDEVYNLSTQQNFKNFSNENEIIAHLLQTLRNYNSDRADLYGRWFQEILNTRVFSDTLSMSPIADAGTVITPKGCLPKQAAIFMTESGAANGRYVYDQMLWEEASPLDRAYLILHEMIYREAKLPENRHLNSMATRYLTAYLFNRSGTLKDYELIQVLLKTKFRKAQFNGTPVILTYTNGNGELLYAPIGYYPRTPYLSSAVLDDSFDLHVGKNRFRRNCSVAERSKSLPKNHVEFYKNGKIKKITFEVLENVPGCGAINGFNNFEFDEAGKIISSALTSDL